MALAKILSKSIRDLRGRLSACEAGNILPLTAGAFLVLAGLVGGGVDISRAYMVKNRLQNACDAGTLAGRKAVLTNGYDSTAEAAADRFFDINFDEAGENVTGTIFATSSIDNGNTVNGTATTDMKTVIMGLFGIDALDLAAECTASMAVGNSDVMMVLDTTYSMTGSLSGGTRMSVLQDAMENFYDTIATATTGSNARVRYGFVPYSMTVNVGRLLPASYLNDEVSIPSREAVTIQHDTITYTYGDPVTTNSSSTTDGGGSDWMLYNNYGYYYSYQCEGGLPSSTSWQNNGSPSTNTNSWTNGQGDLISQTTTSQAQKRTEYICYFSNYYYRYYRIYREQYQYLNSIETTTQEQIEEITSTEVFDKWNYTNVDDIPVGTYKTFAPQSYNNRDYDGGAESYTWDGCIEERGTISASSFSFSTVMGMTPYSWDLDIDSAPDGTPQSKWSPILRQMSYVRGTSWQNTWNVDDNETGSQTYTRCPAQSKLFSTMNEAEFDAVADSLTPDGFTYHDLGMIWGARLSSPDGIFASNVNELPANGQSVARHIIYMTDGEIAPNNAIHSAYGVEMEKYYPKVSDDGTDLSSRHTSRFLAVCEATKAKGIRLWVIAFATALTTDLMACASSDSSFIAANADQLNEAFQEIAKDVGELRITQ